MTAPRQLIVPDRAHDIDISPPSDLGALMKVIERAATDPSFDIDKLSKLLDVKERWEAAEARKAFTAAMAAFKANPPQIVKDKRVQFTTSKGTITYDHATLGNVCASIVKGLAEHGISHRWDLAQSDGRIKVTCVLTHARGHSESVSLHAQPEDSGSKNAIQQMGSTITYLQRYSLLGAVGLASEDEMPDDDGCIDADRPPLPVDVVNALKDASKEGTEALGKCFKSLSEQTRARIVADYSEEWATLKGDAAKVAK